MKNREKTNITATALSKSGVEKIEAWTGTSLDQAAKEAWYLDATKHDSSAFFDTSTKSLAFDVSIEKGTWASGLSTLALSFEDFEWQVEPLIEE